MAIWLPILIIALILGTLHKSEHKRKIDFGFVVVILMAALLIWSAQY